MKNDVRKYLLINILLMFLIITACISIFLWYSSTHNGQKKELEKNVASMKEDISFYQERKKDYSVKDVTQEIIDANLNVTEKMKITKELLNKELKKVYSDIKTKEDYEKLKGEIKGSLGEELSDKLLKLAEPTLNQTGELAFPYDEMLDSKISFGEYDITEQSMVCNVLVSWQSPPLDASNTGVKKEVQSKKLTGEDFFVLTYTLSDDSFKVIDYQQSIDIEGGSNE